MATFLRLPCYAAYACSALLGYLSHHLLARPVLLLSSAFSRTIIGRRTFILGSRLSLGLRHMICTLWLAFIAIPIISLPYLLPVAALWSLWLALILAMMLVFLAFNHSGRVLTATNRGGGRWNVHLNVLRARNQTSSVQWDGAFADLDSIASMARRARLKALTLDSTLLVHDATAKRLKRKLERTFSKHGLVANVGIQPPRALGVWGTGAIHVLRARQRHLKAHRAVVDAPLSLQSREIRVTLSSTARSPLKGLGPLSRRIGPVGPASIFLSPNSNQRTKYMSTKLPWNPTGAQDAEELMNILFTTACALKTQTLSSSHLASPDLAALRTRLGEIADELHGLQADAAGHP